MILSSYDARAMDYTRTRKNNYYSTENQSHTNFNAQTCELRRSQFWMRMNFVFFAVLCAQKILALFESINFRAYSNQITKLSFKNLWIELYFWFVKWEHLIKLASVVNHINCDWNLMCFCEIPNFLRAHNNSKRSLL